MFLLNDKPLALDVPFTHEEIQYPANWLRLASPEERAAIGITEVPDEPIYDDRFYWGPNNPKDLTQLKTNTIAQIKAIAGSLLSVTDWKIIRASEGIKPCDQETLDARSAIRTASNFNEDIVMACTSVNELAAIKFNWPFEKQSDT